MSASESFTSQVSGLSSEGYGICRHPDGRVFFVTGTWPGDEGDFEIVSTQKRYGFAKILKLTKLSDDRQTPSCAHQGFESGTCGGCPWMIGTYASQLKAKEHRVRFAYDRGHLMSAQTQLLPIIGAPSELGYRNRAQFKTDGTQLGFVSFESNTIVDVKDCLVLNDSMREQLKSLRGQLPKSEWAPPPPHRWQFIEVDDGTAIGEDIRINKKRPFRQGNTAQNEVMRTWVKTQVETLIKSDPKLSRALELFCGSGNFTETLAQSGLRSINALEVAPAAIAQLNEKKIPGVTGVLADLMKPGWENIVLRKNPDAQLLFLDPPRDGAAGLFKLVEGFKALKYVIYVSCDIATMVRDLALFCGTDEKSPWYVETVQPLDLFPQTSHVEVMAVVKRRR